MSEVRLYVVGSSLKGSTPLEGVACLSEPSSDSGAGKKERGERVGQVKKKIRRKEKKKKREINS